MIQIDKKEWKFIGWVWLIVVFLTFLPTIVGVITTPPDSVFLGRQGMNGGDLPIYYSQIEQVKEGHFLFKNLFTSESHPGFIFDPFWSAVGLLAKIFSLSSFLAFQLSKFLLIPVLLIVSYYFVAFFFQDQLRRKICFIFLIFASGLGGFYFIEFNNSLPKTGDVFVFSEKEMSRLPLDLFTVEASTFFSIHNSPHFIASLTLIILIFLLSLLAVENYKLIYSIGAGLSALFLFQFHPYHLPTIFGVLGVFLISLLLKEKRLNFNYLKHYFILLLFSLPPVIYHFWTLQKFWIRKAHFLQFATPTPVLPIIFISYGFLIIFALIGIYSIFQRSEKGIEDYNPPTTLQPKPAHPKKAALTAIPKGSLDQKDIFLLSWFFTQFLLIYAPLPFQRRLTTGLHLSLIILTIFGLFYLKDLLYEKPIVQKYFKRVFSNKIFLIYLFFILFFFSNFLILINDLSLYLKNYYRMYLKKEVRTAMLWLRENTSQESVIFSLQETGNLIPAFSLRQVYLGHGHQTVQFDKKLAETEKFFQNSNDEERQIFLEENKIDYLFFGEEEKKESSFNPDEKEFLEKVYSNNQVAIYKIK